MDLSGKNILLGVTGGIAAYKSVLLLREYQKAGANVRVTMTPSATRFVGVETFSTLSRHDVAVDVFNDNHPGDSWTKHIHWSEWADIIVIAPCTANTLAKLVHGQADNMLTSVALASRTPLLLCPTMDAEMIRHPAVVKNLQLAQEYDFYLMPPEKGYLASGLEGSGRLPDIEMILEKTLWVLEKSRGEGPLTKRKIVVTAGPTREYIDPVRYISNPSSGKMGIEMARAACNLGGSVTLLHGPIQDFETDTSRHPSAGSRRLPQSVETESFHSADDLFQLIQKHADADVVIMAAAVADYRPAATAGQKMKKEAKSLTLELESTPDSLHWLGKNKGEKQVLIGFAMETEKLEENARKKLEQKNLDWICANDLTQPDAGFSSDTNHILLLGADSRMEFSGSKQSISKKILQHIFQIK